MHSRQQINISTFYNGRLPVAFIYYNLFKNIWADSTVQVEWVTFAPLPTNLSRDAFSILGNLATTEGKTIMWLW